jgi:hypothetical protein
LRNRKNENARQILDILDSTTGKMRIYIALAFLLLLCREYFRLRNRKNENARQILDILDSATGKMRIYIARQEK